MKNNTMSKMESELIRKGDVIKLIEYIKNDSSIPKNYATLLYIINLITVMPEAYSIENVIEALRKDIEDNVDCDTGEPCNNWVVDMVNEITERHIEIVKRGMGNKN